MLAPALDLTTSVRGDFQDSTNKTPICERTGVLATFVFLTEARFSQHPASGIPNSLPSLLRTDSERGALLLSLLCKSVKEIKPLSLNEACMV